MSSEILSIALSGRFSIHLKSRLRRADLLSLICVDSAESASFPYFSRFEMYIEKGHKRSVLDYPPESVDGATISTLNRESKKVGASIR
jgi:hypothetical protein